jgi:hypothetical protein
VPLALGGSFPPIKGPLHMQYKSSIVQQSTLYLSQKWCFTIQGHKKWLDIDKI